MSEVWNLPGRGIISGLVDLDEARAADERERVRALMEQTTSAVRHEAVAQALSEIEHELLPVVRVELAQELAGRKLLSPRTLALYKQDLAAFKVWCSTYPTPLPWSPAPPQAVAGYLAHLGSTGGNVKRAAAAISRFHRNSINDADPTNDALVRAVITYVKKHSTNY